MWKLVASFVTNNCLTLFYDAVPHVITCTALEVGWEARPRLFCGSLILRNLPGGAENLRIHFLDKSPEGTADVLLTTRSAHWAWTQYSWNVRCLAKHTREFVRSITNKWQPFTNVSSRNTNQSRILLAHYEHRLNRINLLGWQIVVRKEKYSGLKMTADSSETAAPINQNIRRHNIPKDRNLSTERVRNDVLQLYSWDT
jgi:hypothetical protein